MNLTMENTINNMEFDEMRAQLALLKEKLNKEELVNERLLRETMHVKARNINREAVLSVVAALFVIVMMPFSFRPMGFSLQFCIGTVIFMLVCIGATLYQHRDVNSCTMDGDLLTVAKVMRRLKKSYRDWFKFSIPAAVLWFGWMGYEVYCISGNWKVVAMVMSSALVGGIIGGIIGFASYKRVIRTCDEIISSIES